MKIYRNVNEIKRKEQIGRRFSFAGLAILFVGLFASFTPNLYPPGEVPPHQFGAFMQQYWTYISFAALPAGFILASLGSYFINRFARRRWPGSQHVERPDEKLQRNLKGFDDKYAYFAYALPEASYALAGPCGILIFAVRSDRGRVIASGDRWREPFNIGRIFTVFAREGVGNPGADIEEQAGRLRKFIAESDQAEVLADIPINGAAVFLNPDVRLEADNPTPPALRGDQVKDHVRRLTKEVKLQSSTARALTDLLAAHSMHQDGEAE